MATQTKETSRAAKFVPPTVLQRPALGDTDTQKQTEVTKTQTVLQVAKETTSEEVLSSEVRPASDEHSYAAKPAVNGNTTSANKENSSSDSSSEGSSSESSSSSEGESEGEEKKTDKPGESTPSALTTPLRRGRGRPRKYADVYAAATPPSTSSGVTSLGRKRTSSGRTQKTPVRIIQNSPGEPNSNRKRGRGCGNCPGCLRDDCGTCAYCKDKPKFGGPGRKKQRCSLRVCSNFVTAPGVRNTKYQQASPQTPAAAPTASPTKEMKPTPAKPKATPTLQLVTSKPKTRATPQAPTTKPKTSPIQTTTKVSTPAGAAAAAAITVTSVTSLATTTTKAPGKKTELVEKSSDAKVRCIHCGRERKQSIARNGKFCSQRCILQWLADHPEKTLEDAIANATPSSSTLPALTSDELKQKSARELKNLFIDMALPGSTLAAPSSPQASPSPPPTTNPLSPPILAPSPKPLTSTTTITTRKSAQQHQTLAATKKEMAAVAGTKRPGPSHPVTTKKPKEDQVIVTPVTASTTRSVTFDLGTVTTTATTVPVTTVQVQPLSAPPLSRTVPPPSISIVPLDQLSALGTALLSQQKKKQLNKQSKTILGSLPADPRLWTVAQVVHYFHSTSDCRDFAELFREQEVDGTALLLLSHESLVKCLGIKLGRALKIMVHVEELRKEYESQS